MVASLPGDSNILILLLIRNSRLLDSGDMFTSTESDTSTTITL